MFCFETLPVLRQNCNSGQKCTLDKHLQRDITGLAFVFESVTSMYFGCELFTRLLCCDKKIAFLVDFLNIIDLLDLLIYLTYALTRSLAIQQYGHFGFQCFNAV